MRRRGVAAAASAVSMAIAVAAVLRARTRRYVIREASMMPTLAPGDWVIARHRSRALERADIVVFDDPSGSGRSLVKRVIGLPGERVRVDAGRVTIDGALLADRWASGSTRPDGSWEVGPNEVWVVGDHRTLSASDSRTIGPIPITSIDWLVVARYWPNNRIGRVA